MKEITLEISVVEQMFKTLKKSLSKDKARPILEWIKCEVKGNKLLAVALDGYMMTTFAVNIKEEFEEEFGFYIQPFYIPRYKNGGTVKFFADSKNEIMVEIKSFTSPNKLIYAIKQPGDNFIEWRNVIPETDDELKIFVNARMLVDVLEGFKCSPMANNEICIKFKRHKNGIDCVAPMIVEQNTKDGITRSGLLLPIRHLE